MFYTIYKVTHTDSGKEYIGMHQTKNLDDGYMESGKRLKHAINKYGEKLFRKEILHIFDNEDDMKNNGKELVTEQYIKSDGNYNTVCRGLLRIQLHKQQWHKRYAR